MNYSFIQWWIFVSLVTIITLSAFGLVPQKARDLQNQVYTFMLHKNISASVESPNVSLESAVVVVPEFPTRVTIESANIDFVIVEPESADITILDKALSKGIVHYPGSGLLGEESNVFLFGHSSNLKNVRNPAYKALTGIEKVSIGDEIVVESDTKEYIYKVTSVRLAKSHEIRVDFNTGEKELTLSTCDTFGKKEDRYVVRAEFISSQSYE